MMLNVGSYIADRYEVLGKVGAGGMSDVYKAKDHILGREVVVKILKQEFAEDATFVAKFRTEAQSAAGLEHPNIVNIYDVGSEDGLYFIVMEYVEGITLKSYIEKKGQLTYKESLSIAIQVGRGIEAAHNKGIVHRDIKPQNILISTDGKVKVTDFGIARATTSNTIHSEVMGSVHYTSPEQARNGYVDFKSDIYSLGIVMYEMVTGRLPFDGDSTVNVALQHLQENMIPPSVYVSDLPISVEKIILKATMKSPDRRYASMADMLLDLKKALVTPNEDFVTFVGGDEAEKTRVISEEEQEQIREELLREQEEQDEYDDEYDEDDEDEDGQVNSKLDKAITIMAIAAAVVIIAIIIYIVGSFAGIFNFSSSSSDEEETEVETEVDEEESTNQVAMINVLGMGEEEASSSLDEAGILYEILYASSDDVAEGLVMAQSVNEGEMIAADEQVDITVSSGTGTIEIPNVTGMSEDTAKKTLANAGFNVNTAYEYSTDVTEGTVISYTPTGVGASGDTITITVSSGLETVQVPDVAGMTQEEASNALAAVGLKVGNITTEYSENVAQGCVISQGTAAGKTVDMNSSVDLIISDGSEPVYYSYSGMVYENNTEEDVTVTITMTDADGTVISTWSNETIQAGQGYSINASNVASSTATITVTGTTASGVAINESIPITLTPQ